MIFIRPAPCGVETAPPPPLPCGGACGRGGATSSGSHETIGLSDGHTADSNAESPAAAAARAAASRWKRSSVMPSPSPSSTSSSSSLRSSSLPRDVPARCEPSVGDSGGGAWRVGASASDDDENDSPWTLRPPAQSGGSDHRRGSDPSLSPTVVTLSSRCARAEEKCNDGGRCDGSAAPRAAVPTDGAADPVSAAARDATVAKALVASVMERSSAPWERRVAQGMNPVQSRVQRVVWV